RPRRAQVRRTPRRRSSLRSPRQRGDGRGRSDDFGARSRHSRRADVPRMAFDPSSVVAVSERREAGIPPSSERGPSGPAASPPRAEKTIPLEVDELTPEWLSDAMDAEVTSVTVLDRHSGTTGRAHLALTGHASIPATVFAQLAPFDAGQRKFVNLQGMGVAEARLYRDLAPELPVRVPKPWYAEFEGDGPGPDDRYVMLLEDLQASGCRFPTREDADIEGRIFDIVEQ